MALPPDIAKGLLALRSLEETVSAAVKAYLERQILPVNLTLYWIDQEVLRLQRKYQRQHSNKNTFQQHEIRLCRFLATHQQQAAVKYYLDHFAPHRFEDGIVPYPRGVLPHQQDAKYVLDLQMQIERAEIAGECVSSLLRKERGYIRETTSHYLEKGVLTAAEARDICARSVRANRPTTLASLSPADRAKRIRELRVRHAPKDTGQSVLVGGRDKDRPVDLESLPGSDDEHDAPSACGMHSFG